MGSVYFDDILISEGVLDAERLLSSNEQVGGMPRRQSASATQIVTAANGELVFGEELKFIVVLQRRTVRVADAVTHSWWQLEAKGDTNVFGDMHLFVSEHPWSACYANDTRFKATHKDAAVTEQNPASWPKDMSLEQVIARTRGFMHDFWENSSKLRTATLDAPGDAMNVHRTRQATHSWLTFGVISAPAVRRQQDESLRKKFVDELELKLLKEPEIQRMLAQTKRREIDFVPAVARRNTARRQRLHRSVVPDAFASMHTAVRQALAGVPGGDNPGLSSEEWYGRPVRDLVSKIYLQHLYDAHRRATYRYRDRKTESYEEER